ncbi:MAG: serpin family protein, partial [Polyangia bacterium]
LALESRGQGQTGVDGSPFKLSIANALWGQEGSTFLPAFLDTIAVNYGAGVHPLDFLHSPDPSRITINDWVAKETSNKILDLIPEGAINSDTRLVLTNAVYFNASWATAFEQSATKDAAFTLADGSTVQAPTMHGGFEGEGFSDDTMQAVQIEYAGDELSMVVMQPKDLAAFESSLSPAVLDGVLAKLAPAYITLSLPKWKVTDSHGLSAPLKALGMTDAFGDADFSGMDGAKDFVIQDVLHKAYIAVDEKGTEAAAATAVVIGTTSIESNQLSLSFDHPYLYVIRDNATGAVVFMGRISDPTK